MRLRGIPQKKRSHILFLYFLSLLYLLSFSFSADAATPPDAPPVILIQDATVMTVSHGTIEHGSILIKDGKIAEVGQSDAPAISSLGVGPSKVGESACVEVVDELLEPVVIAATHRRIVRAFSGQGGYAVDTTAPARRDRHSVGGIQTLLIQRHGKLGA